MESAGFVAAGKVKAELEEVRASAHKWQKLSKGTLCFVAAGLGFKTAQSTYTYNPSQCSGSAQVPSIRRSSRRLSLWSAVFLQKHHVSRVAHIYSFLLPTLMAGTDR